MSTVTALGISFHLAIAVATVAVMKNGQTPETWTVFSRLLQQPFWSILLNTDTGTSKMVRPLITWTIRFATMNSIVITLAGIITPLRLYNTNNSFVQSQTLYTVNDNHPLSQAITNRSLYRDPGYGGIGPLDMQFRTFQTDVIQQVADGAVFTQGVFQYQQTVSTSGTPFATSNLIIDKTETHGVRILNMNSPYLETGGNWTQHAIWIEPVTECVDHNVTYDFTVPDATPDVTTPQLSAQAITDRGRFANFNLNNYQPNQSNARNSSLQAHAYQAANYALKTGAVSFNISSSLVGKSYPITQTYS